MTQNQFATRYARNPNILILFVAAVLCITLATFAGQPPASPKNPVTDTYHGVTIVDDYRWLEDWSNPNVKSWSEAQNAHARSVLDALPNVEQIRARVTEILSAQSVSYGALHFSKGKLFAMKRQPPKQQPFLVVMTSLEEPSKATVLVDPNAMNQKGTTAIDWYEPSPDGKLVAVSLSEGGSEAGDVHIFEVATGRQVHEVIPHAQNGTAGGSLAWTPDSKGFFYTRYPRGTERPDSDHEFYMQVYFHALGSPTREDRYEIGQDFPKIAEIVLECSKNGLVLASVQKGDGGEFQHYLRTTDSKWTQLDTYQDRVVQAVLGETKTGASTPIYLVSRKDAPKGKLLKLEVKENGAPLADALAKASTVVPETKDTLVSAFGSDTGNIVATQERLYLTYQLGGPSEVRVFDAKGRRVKGPRQFPIGSVGGIATTGHRDDVVFLNTSYVEAPAWFAFDPKRGTTTKTALSQPAPVDFSDSEVVREMATSKDGTQVPVNIVRKKGIKLDGTHPCLLTAYGGYGINMTPSFRPANRVLLDQGVIFAQANIRGGGEFGEDWHHQGNLTHKQNVFDDFFAAAQHLVKAKYTNPQRLAIQGGSNGGLLMGATLTQHPDLCRCVISHVGIYDMLRVELSANGAFNIPEFGTVKDETQFKALYAYSPYHHVSTGVKYPPVLLLTGANDPRVDPMQSRKMTARLQEVGATCLLRTSANSGHGMGSSLSQRIEEAVDVNAFLFTQLGVAYRAAQK